MTVKSETSKYPSMTITSIIDEKDKISLSVLGLKKYGTNNMFVHISTKLTSPSAKQEAIDLGYKILGLE